MDINYFKEVLEPEFNNYEITHNFYQKSDFGSLHRFEFNSQEMGGVIDFWDSGWLSIHLVNYLKEVEIINLLLEPSQETEKEKAFEELLQAI